MKAYTYKKFVKLLRKNGFYLDRTRKHHVYKHEDGRTIALPTSGGKDLCTPMCRRLIKENGLKE
jgi:predicted RNA binding protein YcfA (HicA-like mRNA interferase family)